MSDRIYISDEEDAVTGAYILPSNYDNSYSYKNTPYSFQNIPNEAISTNEDTIINELDKAIKGVLKKINEEENNPLKWLKLINTEDFNSENLLEATFEREYANFFGEWIKQNFSYNKDIDLLDTVFENIHFGIFWNSFYLKCYGIWYIGENNSETIEYLQKLGTTSNYFLNDIKQIIIRVTSELGFSLFDNQKFLKGETSPQIREKIASLTTWGIALTRAQKFYHLLKDKSEDSNLLKSYLFIDENKNIFSNFKKSIFMFDIDDNYYGDLNNNFDYGQILYWKTNTDYQAGDLVLGVDKQNFNNLYRCVYSHTSSDKFEKTIEVEQEVKGKKILRVIQQWEYVTDDYEKEIKAIQKAFDATTKKIFNRDDWVRFALPALEGNNFIEYYANGEVKPNSQGILKWDGPTGFTLRQVYHVGLDKNYYGISRTSAQDVTDYREFRQRMAEEGEPLTPTEIAEMEELRLKILEIPRIIQSDYTNAIWDENDWNLIRENVEPWDDVEPLDDYLYNKKPQNSNSDDIYWEDQIGDRYSSPCGSNIVNVNVGGKIIYYFQKTSSTIQVVASLEARLRSIADEAFSNRKELKKVVLRNSVKKIGKRAFNNCINLKQVLLPKNLTTLGENAFSGCSSLARATIPAGVTILDGTYAGCSNLKTVILSKRCTRIGDYTFVNCSNLKRIYNTQRIKYIGTGAFSGCESLEKFTINSSVTELPSRAFKNCKNCVFEIKPLEKLTLLGEGCFDGCEKLTQTVNFSQLTQLYPNTYRNCKSLKTIDFRNFLEPTTIEVTDDSEKIVELNKYVIPHHFCYGCSELQEIIFSDKTQQLDDSCFENCASLTEVTVPDKVNTIGKRIFYDDLQLQTIKVPFYYTPMEGETTHHSSLWIENVINGENKDNWINRAITTVLYKTDGD